MNNFLSKTFDSFFKKEVGSVIGLDIGSSSVKIVQLKKKKGRAVLETYGEIAIGPYANQEIGRATNLSLDKLSEAILDLIKEANVTSNVCCTSIPITSSLISFIKVPDLGEKKLAEIIPLEARKYIPVPTSEVTIDYWVIPTEESAFSEFQSSAKILDEKIKNVLLVVVHNDAKSKNDQLMKMSGLVAASSEIELFSTIRAVTEPGLETQMILDFGARTTKIYIIDRGILRASNIVNRGGQDITLAISRSLGLSFDEAERIKKSTPGGSVIRDVSDLSSVNLDFIFSEVKRVIVNYQKNYNKNISKVFLTGGGANLKGLNESVKVALDLPVEKGNPFGKLEYPAFLENVLKSVGPEFTVAIGLALRQLLDND
ncbi:MAG: type IV pilus assembly protein PilM [Minisyncoccia bacterium]